MQDAVDLRSVFLEGAAPDSSHGKQLAGHSRPRAGHGSQCPIAENAEGQDAASSGLSRRQAHNASSIEEGGPALDPFAPATGLDSAAFPIPRA